MSTSAAMSDVLRDHALGQPLRQTQIDAFVGKGVPPLALARSSLGLYGFINRDRVVFLGDRFEFARNLPDHDGVGAFTFVCFDEDGEPADIAAWRPPEIALWLGSVAMLGEEQVLGIRLGEPLRVHDVVMGWFRASREGVFIVDYPQAAHVLRNETLGVSSVEHARELRLKLTLSAPPVVVLDQSERAA